MSFMAGLADGFAKSFGAMEDRRNAMKQDAFRVAYDSYTKKQAKYEEDAKQDKIWVETAKQITQEVGATPNAWEHAYTYLKGGFTPEQVAERMSRTHFSSVATPAMAENAAGLVPGMADMTKAAGLTMENPANEAASDLTSTKNPAQSNPDLMGSLTGAVGDIFNPEKMRERQFNQANKAVMGAAGVDQATFDKYNTGYTGPELMGGYKVDGVDPKKMPADPNALKPNDAPYIMLKNGGITNGLPQEDGTFKTFAGETITRDMIATNAAGMPIIMSEPMYSNYKSSGEEADNMLKDYRTAKADTRGIVDQLKGLTDMATNNPNVIAKASIISTAFNEIQGELSSVFNQIGSMTDPDIEKAEKGAVAALKQKLIDSDMNASDAQAFASRAISVKFKIARLLNGSGTLTNRDTQEAANLVLSSNDPKIFLRNAKIVARDMANQLDMQSDEFGKSFKIKNAKDLGAIDGSAIAPMSETLDKDSWEWLSTPDEPEVVDPNAAPPAVTWQASEAVVNALKKDYPNLKVGDPVTTDAQGNVIPANK